MPVVTRRLLLEDGAFAGVAAESPLVNDFRSDCFFAWPNSILRQREAKLREHTDSPAL